MCPKSSVFYLNVHGEKTAKVCEFSCHASSSETYKTELIFLPQSLYS